MRYKQNLVEHVVVFRVIAIKDTSEKEKKSKPDRKVLAFFPVFPLIVRQIQITTIAEVTLTKKYCIYRYFRGENS